jgi:hypothetical protein
MGLAQKEPDVLDARAFFVSLRLANDTTLINGSREEPAAAHDVELVGNVALVGKHCPLIKLVFTSDTAQRIERLRVQILEQRQSSQKLALACHDFLGIKPYFNITKA